MKIYGKTKIIGQVDGHPYIEVEYKEYREDGSLKGIGTEDFSTERWSAIHWGFVYTWDGQRRNKGGHRWFDFEGSYRTDDIKAFRKYMRALWNEQGIETVEVRTR